MNKTIVVRLDKTEGYQALGLALSVAVKRAGRSEVKRKTWREGDEIVALAYIY